MIKSLKFKKHPDYPSALIEGPVSLKKEDGSIERKLVIEIVYCDDNKGPDAFFDAMEDMFCDEMSLYRSKIKEKKSC
jgi:hypothetical protein